MPRLSVAYQAVLRTSIHSQKLVRAGRLAHEVYTRLLIISDSYGRFYGSAFQVCARAYPDLMETGEVTVEGIEEDLGALEREGLITRYEVGGKLYLELLEYYDPTEEKRRKAAFPGPPEACPHDGDTVGTDGGHDGPLNHNQNLNQNQNQNQNQNPVMTRGRAREPEPPEPEPGAVPGGPDDFSAKPRGGPDPDPEPGPVGECVELVRQAIAEERARGRPVPELQPGGARALASALEERLVARKDRGPTAAGESLVRDVGRVVEFARRDSVENLAGYVIAAVRKDFASLPAPESQAAAVARAGPKAEKPVDLEERSGTPPDAYGFEGESLKQIHESAERARESLLETPGLPRPVRDRVKAMAIPKDLEQAKRLRGELQRMAIEALEKLEAVG